MLRRVALVTDDSEERIAEAFCEVIVFLRSVLRLLVTANVPSFADSCHLDDGGDMFLRNVGSYKSHTAQHPKDGILHSHGRENLTV
jgi:hypothetical protein